MDINLERPLMKAELPVEEERNRLLGRIDVIQKRLKSPMTLTIGIICTLAVWQIVLLIQLQLTKDKLKKLPQRVIELVKPIAPGPPELPPLENKSPRKEDKKRELTALSPPQQLSVTRNPSVEGQINSNDLLDSEIEKLVREIAELDDKLRLKKQETVNDLKQSHPLPAFKKSNMKNFLVQKLSIVKIQSLIRGMLTKTMVKKEKEIVKEKRLKIDSIVTAFKKAQGAEDKRVAFAKLKTHMVESRRKELEKTLELKEKESYTLEGELYQAALKKEKLATSLVIAKFKLAQKNDKRIRLEKTKVRDEARNIELIELRSKRLQKKQLSKS